MSTSPSKFDLKGLALEGLVVHEIARGTTRLDAAIVAELSTAAAPWDATTMDFLDLQLRNGMTDGAYPAAFLDPTLQAPGAIIALLNGPLSAPTFGKKEDAEVLKVSRDLASSLQTSQMHNSPAGMFALCRGKLNKQPIVAVMKLESQKGLRLVRDKDVMSLEVNPDLFVGNKAKLFKAAVFLLDGNNVRIMICDEQTENRPAHPAAQYFVKDLLGCTIDDDLSVRTGKFFETVGRAADALLDDAQDQTQVLSAIRSELGSNKKTVDPEAFIANNFPDDKKAAVRTFLERNDVELSNFTKDASRVERQFRRITYRFDDGPSVITADSDVKSLPSSQPFDDAYEGVQLKVVAGQTVMQIRGVVNNVTPRS